MEFQDELPPEYGQVLPAPLGDGAQVQIDYWGGLALLEFSGDSVEVGVARVGQRNYLLSELERHRRCSEVNLPVRSDLLVALALRDPNLDPSPDFVVARVRVGSALVIKPGVWHSVAYPMSKVGVYWVFLRRGTGLDD